MKRAIGLAILAGLLSGCELLMPQEENSPEGGQGTQAGGADPAQFVKAPAKLPQLQTEELEVGWTASQDMTSGNQTMTTSYAVVGDTGDAWQVEYVNPGLTSMANNYPELEGQLIGLTVNKDDGEVTKAVLGEPGGEVQEIDIQKSGSAGAAGMQGEGVAEDVTIGLGSFPAKRYEQGGQISWVGTQGEMDGVLLKVEGDEPYELDAMPEASAVTVGGRELNVTKLSYSNGTTYWITPDEVVAAFFSGPGGEDSGLYKMETEDTTMELTDVGTGAEAQLAW